MDEKKIELVELSFEKIVPVANKVADLFYSKLFERNSSLKKLFSGDMSQQGSKLMLMLCTAVNGLRNLDSIVPVVQNLGRAHVGYGVTDDMYEDVKVSLMDALEIGLGDAFTEETKDAWLEVYELLSTTMKNASHKLNVS